MRRGFWLCVLPGLLSIPAPVPAQDVVSARAGLIHYLEGKVFLAGQPIEQTPPAKLFSQFPEVKPTEILRTEAGRAEVLLSPGAVLRLGEDSALRMISNRLTDARLELLAGAAVVDISDLQKENFITVVAGGATLQFKRTGLFEIRADPAGVKVFDGRVEAIVNDRQQTLKRGDAATFGDAITVAKFDPEMGDALTRWSIRRSGYLALASVSAAKSIRDSGYSWTTGGWNFNPYFGMYTFIPARGAACSAFSGFCYYSPLRVDSFLFNSLYFGYPTGLYAGGLRRSYQSAITPGSGAYSRGRSGTFQGGALLGGDGGGFRGGYGGGFRGGYGGGRMSESVSAGAATAPTRSPGGGVSSGGMSGAGAGGGHRGGRGR